jgi:hypothetical protein
VVVFGNQHPGVMSFGWSAGDIAQAVSIIVKVVKALDEVDGAGKHYREAVTFLESLKHTLEPLQTFTALKTYPSYGDEIRKQVQRIKKPIERFLEIAKKFESSLGSGPKDCRRHNIVAKLRWRFINSKALDILKHDIESHIRVLDTLLQRLTL